MYFINLVRVVDIRIIVVGIFYVIIIFVLLVTIGSFGVVV